jgi:hypothetical protein
MADSAGRAMNRAPSTKQSSNGFAALSYKPRDSAALVNIMPQFVIEREIPGAGTLSESQIRDMALQSLETLKEMGPRIQWLHSYVTEDKVYCLYLAPEEDCIREHARRVGIPADRVAAVRRLIDPANLK